MQGHGSDKGCRSIGADTDTSTFLPSLSERGKAAPIRHGKAAVSHLVYSHPNADKDC
jgi:hypothetical protein